MQPKEGGLSYLDIQQPKRGAPNAVVCGAFAALAWSFSPLFARSSRTSRRPLRTAGFWERQTAPPYRKQFIVDSPSFLLRLRQDPPTKNTLPTPPTPQTAARVNFNVKWEQKPKCHGRQRRPVVPQVKVFSGLLSFSFLFSSPPGNQKLSSNTKRADLLTSLFAHFLIT